MKYVWPMRIAVGLAFLVGTAVGAGAQGGQPQSLEGKTAEQAYKNIKVMQGTPANQLNQAMHLIKGAVGLDCEDCHEERDRSADTKKPKLRAREMMKMVMDINKTTFNGEQVVTCYTCHRGSPDPINVPVFPIMEPKEPEKVALPSVDQILSKYVQALGGEQAIRKITSRVITGTEFAPTGPGGTVPTPAQVEIYQKAPNLVVNLYHTPNYTLSDGFDGNTAWTQDFRGRVTEPQPIDQGRAKRSSDFYESVRLKSEYKEMKVDGIERINDRDAYRVIATPAGDNPERLYFDVITGLLVRKVTVLPTPVGDSPFQVTYDDYRDAGNGVKVPFLIEMNPAAARTELAPTATLRVQKVQENVQIDSSKFAKPESKTAELR